MLSIHSIAFVGNSHCVHCGCGEVQCTYFVLTFTKFPYHRGSFSMSPLNDGHRVQCAYHVESELIEHRFFFHGGESVKLIYSIAR